MRSILFIFTLTCLMSLSGYSQETDIQSMLQDQENRGKVYQTIMEDQTYMKEFMQEMHQNKQAMQMMEGNEQMKQKMHGQKMEGMMQNPEMMQNMMRMMHQKGMLSDDCMKAGMKKVKDNSMEMKGRKKGKGMKKGSDDDGHSSHH